MNRDGEQSDVLGDFTKRLEKLGIDYMLTGSLALTRYAMPRNTLDIDIVINLTPESLPAFISEFQADYYIPEGSAKDAVSRKRMFNILNQQTAVKIDCVVLKDNEFQQNAFARRERVNYSDNLELWIISKEDLILSKLNWAKTTKSEMQLRDVASILRNGYDESYVGDWAKKLGVEDLLTECGNLLEKNYADGHDS